MRYLTKRMAVKNGRRSGSAESNEVKSFSFTAKVAPVRSITDIGLLSFFDLCCAAEC